MEPDRSRARQLAKESVEAGDPVGWFERLYQESEHGTAQIPWADMRPNHNLTDWWAARPPQTDPQQQTAVVVGCGLGDDAEFLAAQGFVVTAFDVAPTAIAQALRRFPETPVRYVSADALHPPSEWAGRFDFVFEAYTLQALPTDARAQAIVSVAGFVAPQGYLLIVARGRDANDPAGEMPWPLTRDEFKALEQLGLTLQSWEDYLDGTTRRFRALYRRL
jgi:hypothetical protein